MEQNVMQQNPEEETTLRREHTEDLTDAHCPQCGAAVRFNPASGKLVCAYCGYEGNIPGGESPTPDAVEELDFSQAEQTASRDWGTNKKTVICESCGATMIYDALQNSTVCPYCGSNHVMEQAVMDTMTPGGVVPFSVTAAQAGEKFKKWLKGRWFTPRKAKKNARADAFQGVYLPFWTFDAQTDSIYRGRYGKNRTVHRNGKVEIVTDWFSCSGRYQEFIDDQLVAASTQHEKELLRRVAPFDTKKCVPYRPEYVAGFVSERYQLGLKDGWGEAKDAIRRYLQAQIEDQIRREHHADAASVSYADTRYAAITYKYLLLPLWISAFTYKGKLYRFMVNGQTARVGGKAPISPLRVALAVLLGIALIGLLYWYMYMGGY